MPKPKLELKWIGKETRPRLEPRILIEEPAKSHHAAHRVGESDLFDNKLIFGDNLLALKALEAEYTGKVKCVFIDPPYNTGSAFTHYDDGVEHSIWLGLMRDRLELIKRLLSDDGSLWITIDDNECHYLKIICDEILGRVNFIANVIWQKKHSRQNDARFFSTNHDHIIVFAKNIDSYKLNQLMRTEEMDARLTNPDNDPRGIWMSQPLQVKTPSKSNLYPITTPSGRVITPPNGRSWMCSKTRFEELIEDNRIYFGSDGSNVPRVKKFKYEIKDGVVPNTIWLHEEVGHNQNAKEEIKAFNFLTAFETPKPEKLIQQIIHLATNPGDLVLDSFAGSGTTGAVAHKMGRRWIMVELGEHCHTHIIPRLKKVIDGQDPGGITEAVGWKGGGGFRYYRLAPSLLEKDKWGNWVINKEYNAAMLAEALCKLEGFTYAPSETEYFIHGHSTESDFIWVTTQNLGHEQLAALSEDVGSKRTLLVLCSAYRADTKQFPNLTIKKIPNAVLSKCEWGHDDYSLQVENLPAAPKPKVDQPELFGGVG